MARFKDTSLNRQYDTAMELARTREFVYENHRGETLLRTGASHRTAFWNGYHHFPFNYVRGSLCHAYYAAGKDFRKETDEYVGLENTSSGHTHEDMKA